MNNKKLIITSIILIIVVIISAVTTAVVLNKKTTVEVIDKKYLSALPAPELAGGARGELGVDKNINEDTIDQYLNREDSVYRDMRMLEDPAKYEKIGGDRFLSGFIEGFEVVPLPYIIPVSGLPEAVGETYKGTTLFNFENGSYSPNFEESMSIIENYFPKDKNIFLMCGGGGYAGMMKNFLVAMGWNENKIYNIGGYWYYKGNHNVVVREEVDGSVTYNFSKVKYHNIEFDNLTKATSFKDPNIKVNEVKLSTNKIELEEGTSFQLNVIVLPNEAENKDVKWTSSDETIAKVTEEGLVKGIKAGNATIKVQAVEGTKEDISATCEVIVTPAEVLEKVKLDDISSESKLFAENNPDTILDNFYDSVYDKDGDVKEEYRWYFTVANTTYYNADEEKISKERDYYYEKAEEASNKRKDIINKMISERKSFIILYHVETCEERPYSVYTGAQKVLKENNYQYLLIGDEYGFDNSIYDSNLNNNNLGDGSILIVKDGKIYGSIDFDKISIKDEQEFKTWLNKYIDIE